jgi:hypothetical protein
MVQSKAKTVQEYLAELPEERRRIIRKVRALVRKHLPKGYVESMNWGMISYEIPLSRYPNTYNKQPLAYVALAAQKSYNALYLMSCYEKSAEQSALAAAYEKAGKRLDMGKSCLRFKRYEDLVPEAIARAIASIPPEEQIAIYEASRKKSRKRS